MGAGVGVVEPSVCSRADLSCMGFAPIQATSERIKRISKRIHT